jgi:DNA-binding NarL/FixJ family response regulator
MADLVVLVVDDHPVVVSGCKTVFARDPSIKVVSANDHKSGLESYKTHRPDVTIVDINLPDLSGFDLLRRIRKAEPDAAVIMLSMNDDPGFVVRSAELGAKGFLSKTDDPRLLLKAVRSVAKGETYITPELAQTVAFAPGAASDESQLNSRELETLRLLAKGHRIGEMAELMGVSYKTVANTTSIMKRKLKARSHSDLIRIAVDMGLKS